MMKKIFTLVILNVLLCHQLFAQQQFNITSSRANNYCNGTCTLFDVPELNGNPTAVIFIKPVEANGVNLNPHPICAYYNGKQWSVVNVDNSTMQPGAQFNVQYYSTPDNDHFTHVVTKETLVKNNSYIDHAGLNGNPDAQFQLFQNASPNVRGGGINKDEIKTQYDETTGKWFIAKTNGNTLDLSTGYNISISSQRSSSSGAVTAVRIPATVPMNAQAAFTPFAATDHSGQRIFITAVGKTQGQFIGENGTTRMEVTAFENETNSPRDLASGQASGKRQHLPVIFQKSTGGASVQFFKALTANEVLSSVTFEVYGSSSSGASVLIYKVVLTNATVSNFKQSFADGGKGFMDTVKLTFQSIEITFVSGAVTATDSWIITN
jgi:type VI secretion system secreted protein Hcp